LPQALEKLLRQPIGGLWTLHIAEGNVGVNKRDPRNLCRLRSSKQRRGRTCGNESDELPASCDGFN